MSGNDSFSAILLGMITSLKRLEKELHCEIIFIFESKSLSFTGSKAIMESGFLDNIEYIYNFNDLYNLDSGTFAISDGFQMVGSDYLKLKWYGESYPTSFIHEAKDPLVAACQFAANVRSLISSNINPIDIALATVTELLSGGHHNITPDYCEMTLNIRYVDERVRKNIYKIIMDYVKLLENQFKLTCNITKQINVNPTINNTQAYQLAKASALKIVDESKIKDYTPTLNCHSFSAYLQKYKGAVIYFGSKGEKDASPYYSKEYNPDEESFKYVNAWLIQIVLDYLKIK